MKEKIILENKAQCKLCNDIIISKSVHNFVECKCGEIFVDGGNEYLRRGATDLKNIIELSKYKNTKK